MKGDTIILAEAPMITPPARVAFTTYSELSFPPWNNIEVIMLENTDAIIERVVFTAALCFVFPTSRAELNDGQYIHKKTVPMNEKRFE